MITSSGKPLSPLTGRDNHLRVVHEIKVEQLIAGYKDRIGIDISQAFPNMEKLYCIRDDETSLSFFNPMVFGDETFYKALAAKQQNYYPANKQEFLISKAAVFDGARICEIGAGMGHFVQHIPTAKYVGLELSGAAVEGGRALGRNLLREDVYDFANHNVEAFDATCAFQVLEHVANPLRFLEAAASMTKAGGKIIVSTPNGEGYIARSRDLLNLPPHHYTWWEDRTWYWVKEKLGFSGLDLRHTMIDENLYSWAQMVASDGLARLLGLELHPIMDETPLRRRIDAMSEMTTKIILAGVRHRNDAPPVGHTTVAIFTK